MTASADRDAYIASAGARDATATELDVGYRNFNPVQEYRIAVHFTLPSEVAQGAVGSAKLRLYYFDAWGSFTARQVRIYRAAAAWTEANVSFSTPFSAAYAGQTVGGTAFGYIDWEVTDHVRAWASGPEANNGFIMAADPVGSNDNCFRFHSRRITDPARVPQLVINVLPPPSQEPNLRPAPVTGTSSPLAWSWRSDDPTAEVPYANETGYLTWAVENGGLTAAGPFKVRVLVGGLFGTTLP